MSRDTGYDVGDSRSGRNSGRLPPIRELFRAELGHSPPPNVSASLYPMSRMQRPVYDSRVKPEYVSMSLNGQAAGPPSSWSSRHASGPQQPYTHPSNDRFDTRLAVDGPSYAVLRTSAASGSLTDAIPPSHRPQGIIRQTSSLSADDAEDPSKRYRCEYCGKRFAMPSHYQIHLRSHTAEKPFVCDYPGCYRKFTVKGNLTRHLRTHSKECI